MIERRNRRDDAIQRKARGEDLALLALRRDVARVGLAVVLDGQLPGKRIDVIGAAGFVERILPAQTRLCRDDARKLFFARREQVGGLEQDLLALVTRELRLEGFRLRESLAHMLRPRCRDGADHRAVVRVEHLDNLIGLDALAGDAHRLVADRRLGVDVHAATLFSATSKISKLRNWCPSASVTSRLAIIGTTCSVSPPCERSGSVRPERSCFSRAGPRTLWMVETTTPAPERSAGSSHRR